MYLVLIFWRAKLREQGSWEKPVERVVCDGNRSAIPSFYKSFRQYSQMLVSAQGQETQLYMEFIQITHSIYL